MKAQPFFVVTGCLVGSRSQPTSRHHWWVVSVELEESAANKLCVKLTKQAQRFEERAAVFREDCRRRLRAFFDRPGVTNTLLPGLATYPGQGVTFGVTGQTITSSMSYPTMAPASGARQEPTRFGPQAEDPLYQESLAIQQGCYDNLDILKRRMIDKRFPFHISKVETPVYSVISAFDDPTVGEPVNILQERPR